MLIGLLIPLALAYFFGAKSETTYEDQMTGRLKHESNWIGLMLYEKIEENEVSKWADNNSLQGLYPAQYGWTAVSSHGRGWFSSTEIACGGGHAIPLWIFMGKIKMDGLTREEVLKRYQTEVIALYNEHHSIESAERIWLAKREVTPHKNAE